MLLNRQLNARDCYTHISMTDSRACVATSLIGLPEISFDTNEPCSVCTHTDPFCRHTHTVHTLLCSRVQPTAVTKVNCLPFASNNRNNYPSNHRNRKRKLCELNHVETNLKVVRNEICHVLGMKLKVAIIQFLLVLLGGHSYLAEGQDQPAGRISGARYLLYSANPGEGFNLRRDVHVRAATLVHELRKTGNWILVLPPWPHLYHWKSSFLQTDIKWERFFDVPSLNEYVPSIEFQDYLARKGRVIDEVYNSSLVVGPTSTSQHCPYWY